MRYTLDNLENFCLDPICGCRLDSYMEKIMFEKEIDEKTKKIIKEKRIYKFYTNENLYIITAIQKNNDEGYLGCVFLSRKTRPGERWVRGNDLPDGPLTTATWENIKNHIILNELIKFEVSNKQPNKESNTSISQEIESFEKMKF